MSEKQKNWTNIQAQIAADLCLTYGIDEEEIIFFGDNPKPLLSYEATCVLCNQLTNLKGIQIEPVASPFQDSFTVRCILTLNNGDKRESWGVTNKNEIVDGATLSESQIFQSASSKAIRNALRAAGIDLIRLHNQMKNGENELIYSPTKNAITTLLAQAHILGKEAELIILDPVTKQVDKTAWHRLIRNRYGKNHSNELSEAALTDFVAVLKTLVPQGQVLAA
ncbi:MAG: hypothetical protein K1X72_04430 [Pyrinomonadaceae bacterium]|nr:hypothetical protein [Pyrinomonadaceae bacterium]